MAQSHEYRQRAPAARELPVTVIAQDPAMRVDGLILRAEVLIPAERFEPGPRGARLQVIDYDASAAQLMPPAPAPDGTDPWKAISDQQLLADRSFHAHNLFAIAARTLATFEFALGRRLPWSFGSHRLYLVPHAFAEANAFYSADDHAVLFGYVPQPQGGRLLTCLSHDVVAHEITHAVLDGLRPRYQEPGLPDQAAFHDPFSDVVALLSVFAMEPVVENLLGATDQRGRIPSRAASEEALRGTALFGLAEQLGRGGVDDHGEALRRSTELPLGPGWRSDPAFAEPHRRGEVLVAAVMRTLARMWARRLEPITTRAGVDRARAAEEGAKAAEHLLRMAIRAIDYTPPVEFEFEDFLDAMLLADEVMAPDDAHGYRAALQAGFAEFDSHRPPIQIIDLARRGGLSTTT